MPYALLADAVLVLHLGVVLFVIGGLAAVFVGNARGWHWVNRRGFRLLHLAAIVLVALQAWLGQTCPLTLLENGLRQRAGTAGYAGGFVEHWVQWLLFYEAPTWVFTLGYTLFALAVGTAWWRYPPRARTPRSRTRCPSS